jgi:hypothetical protein
LRHLCQAAETGKTLDAETLAALVPGLSRAGAGNLAMYLVDIGLADEQGGLTRTGKSCAATGMAPAWEFGAYDFLVANHQLIGCVFLDLRRSQNDPNDYDFKSLTALPAWLTYSREQVFVSAYDASNRFSVYEVSKGRQGSGGCRCDRLGHGELTVTVHDLQTGQADWRIQGRGAGDGGPWGPFASPPEPLPSAPFAGLMSSWDRRWKPIENYLAIPFDGRVDALGREQFKRNVDYSNVTVGLPNGGGGVVFETADVDDVPVGPSSSEEAAKWAIAIASTRLTHDNAYVGEADWDQLWQAEIANSPLGPALDRPLTSSEVIDRPDAELSPRVRWLLAAAVDLAVE